MKLGKGHAQFAIYNANSAIHYAKECVKLDGMLVVMYGIAGYVFTPALFGDDLLFQIASWIVMWSLTPAFLWILVSIPKDLRRVKDAKKQRINLLNTMMASDDPDAREQASRELQRKDPNNETA